MDQKQTILAQFLNVGFIGLVGDPPYQVINIKKAAGGNQRL